MYKKGDIIRCINTKGIEDVDFAPITIGRKYTVTDTMHKDDVCVMVVTDNGKAFAYYAYRYELANKTLSTNTRTL